MKKSLQPVRPCLVALLFLAVVLAAFSGCLGEEEEEEGRVTVYVKDQATDDFQQLFVMIENVSVHRSSDADEEDGEWVVLVDSSREVDLLAYSGNDSRAFLGDENLSAGRYSMIRMDVSEARGVDHDGQDVEIEVSSGTLRVVRSFNVSADETTRVVLDFDLDRPGVLVQQGGPGGQGGGGWRMTPVIGTVRVEEGLEEDPGEDVQ